MYKLSSTVAVAFALAIILSHECSYAQSDTLWTKTFAGPDGDYGQSVQQTAGGGFIIAGHTNSYDLNGLGGSDVRLIKVDSDGDTLWSRIYGGSGWDGAYSVQETADSGFIVAGFTTSFGAGSKDLYLIRTDSLGDTVWTRVYGGTGQEEGYSVKQISDGGYLVVGWTDSGGDADAWLLRTDALGDTAWARSFGTGQGDWGRAALELYDGGFIIVGSSWGYSPGHSQIYIVKTDSDGNHVWTRTQGGGDDEHAGSVQPTSDSGLVISGWTTSFGAGGKDVYLLKVDSLGDTVWTKSYGGAQDDGSDGFCSMKTMPDSGFVITGWTNSFGSGGSDVWLLRTDKDGDTLWTMTFGGTGDDEGWSVVWDSTAMDMSYNEYVIAGFSSSFGIGSDDVYLIDLIKSDADGDYGLSIQQTADGGFVIAGQTNSNGLYGIGGSDICLIKTDSDGDTLWSKLYGGSGWDRAYSVQQTSDSGFVIVGYTTSFGAGGKDLYLIRTDSLGDTVWTRTYGGTGWDEGYSVRQTYDDGYIIAGWTDSDEYGPVSADAWLLRTDALGDTAWTRSFGTVEGDWGRSVEETADSGFIMVGSTYGHGDQAQIQVVRTDSLGNPTWEKWHGGSLEESSGSVQQTPDGGFVISGWTLSYGAGGKDLYLMKLDSSGDTVWTRVYGGAQDDVSDGFCALKALPDSGFVVAGWTKSFGAGAADVWLMEVDSLGDSIWSQTYGGTGDDQGWSVALDTSDNGYVIAGFSSSYGTGTDDIHLIKTDSVGGTLWTQTLDNSAADTLWTRTVGSIDSDYGRSVQQTIDGGFIITGHMNSGDLNGIGGSDICLIRTDPDGDTLWSRQYGGLGWDGAYSVQQTSDTGFVVVGFTTSFGAGDKDLYLIKTDSLGDTVWTRTYGGTDWDEGYSVRQTYDDGYIIAGWTDSYGDVGANAWLFRTDPDGDSVWAYTFGTDEGDWGRSVEETADSGFIMVGSTWGIPGQSQIQVVRTDSLGIAIWEKWHGGSAEEHGGTVQPTPDGGFVISGWTKTYGAGGKDLYLMKLDSSGDTVWTRVYGGAQDDGSDGFCSLKRTSDGGFIVTGWTKSFGAGGSDVWILRTNELGDTLWTMTVGGTGNDEGWSIDVDNTDDGYIVTGWTESFGSAPDIYLIKLGTDPVDAEEDIDVLVPGEFTLHQNSPNPFNAATEIRFSLPKASAVKLEILNILGQKVITLIDDDLKPGHHTVLWNGIDFNGQTVATGIYFYRLRAGDLHDSKKMLLLK